MRTRNPTVETTIPYGDASTLLPVEELDAGVVQNRDAELRLAALDPDEVLTVAPESMASGYALGSHPLTLVEVASLSGTRARALADASGVALERFSHVRIGRAVRSGANHSLSEFRS
jgi:hypothetical protein